VAIDGMAGAGKTALAVRAARSLADRYPDGCLFLDLYGHRAEREPLSPERAVRRLLRSVGADDSVSAADSADTDDADRFDDLVGSWRNATSGRRLLLILDDAVRAEHIRPLIPAGEGSLVIATSRRRLPGLDADARFSLGPLGEEDAVGLLTRIVGGVLADREDAEAAREVARLCGGLPLALKIVGARLQSRQSWDLRNLAARLVDDEVRLVELTAEDRSVEAAFRLSFDQLPHTEQLAFVALGACPAVRLDGLTLSSMLGCSPEDAEQALVNLVDASLVEQVSAESYQAHELVAAYARRLASADPERARTAGRVSGP
jgi:hypothetical protein